MMFLGRKKNGSAMVVIVILMSVVIPLALTLTNLNIMLGQNNLRAADSMIADAAVQAGVADVKANITKIQNATPSGNFDSYLVVNSSYYVKLTDKSSPTSYDYGTDSDLLKTFSRAKQYYTVARQANVSGSPSFMVRGYYGGIKHEYTVNVTPASTNVTAQGYLVASKFNSSNTTTCASYLDTVTKRYYSWDNWGELRIFDVANPSAPAELTEYRVVNSPSNFACIVSAGNVMTNSSMVVKGDYLYLMLNDSTTDAPTLYVLNVKTSSIQTVYTINPIIPTSVQGLTPGYKLLGRNIALSPDGYSLYMAITEELVKTPGSPDPDLPKCGLSIYEGSLTCWQDVLIRYDISNQAASPTMDSHEFDSVWQKKDNGSSYYKSNKVNVLDVGVVPYAFYMRYDIADARNEVTIMDLTNFSNLTPKKFSLPYSSLTAVGGYLPASLNGSYMKFLDAVVVNNFLYLSGGNFNSSLNSGGIVVVNLSDSSYPTVATYCAGDRNNWLGLTVSSNNQLYATSSNPSTGTVNQWDGLYEFNIQPDGTLTRLSGKNIGHSNYYYVGANNQDNISADRGFGIYGDSLRTLAYANIGATNYIFGAQPAEIFEVFKADAPNLLSTVSIAPVINGVLDMSYGSAGDTHLYVLSETGIQELDANNNVVGNFQLMGTDAAHGQIDAWNLMANIPMKMLINGQDLYLYYFYIPGSPNCGSSNYCGTIMHYKINYSPYANWISYQDQGQYLSGGNNASVGVGETSLPTDVVNSAGGYQYLLVNRFKPSVSGAETPGLIVLYGKTPITPLSLPGGVCTFSGCMPKIAVDSAKKLAYVISYTTITTPGKLSVLDISDPASPTIKISYDINAPTGVAVDDKYIYVSQKDITSNPHIMLTVLDKTNIDKNSNGTIDATDAVRQIPYDSVGVGSGAVGVSGGKVYFDRLHSGSTNNPVLYWLSTSDILTGTAKTVTPPFSINYALNELDNYKITFSPAGDKVVMGVGDNPAGMAINIFSLSSVVSPAGVSVVKVY